MENAAYACLRSHSRAPRTSPAASSVRTRYCPTLCGSYNQHLSKALLICAMKIPLYMCMCVRMCACVCVCACVSVIQIS